MDTQLPIQQAKYCTINIYYFMQCVCPLCTFFVLFSNHCMTITRITGMCMSKLKYPLYLSFIILHSFLPLGNTILLNLCILIIVIIYLLDIRLTISYCCLTENHTYLRHKLYSKLIVIHTFSVELY